MVKCNAHVILRSIKMQWLNRALTTITQLNSYKLKWLSPTLSLELVLTAVYEKNSEEKISRTILSFGQEYTEVIPQSWRVRAEITVKTMFMVFSEQ